MSNLERYLSRATRGLWGRRRAEALAELEEHVLERAQALELGGLPGREALSLALRELGPPERIGAGLTEVHTMPQLVRGALLAAALAALSVAALSPVRAQVEATRDTPTPFLESVSTFFLSLPSLRDNLAALGVPVQGDPDRLEIAFPGSTRPAVLTPPTVQPGPGIIFRFVRDGRTFVRVESLLAAVRDVGLPVTLEGWDNPRLRVGATSFVLGTRAAPVDAYGPYSGRLAGLASDGLEALGLRWRGYDLARWNGNLERYAHTLRVRAGAVYGVVAPAAAFGPGVVHVDVAPATSEGTVALRLPWRHLEFVGDLRALKDDPAWTVGEPPPSGRPSNPSERRVRAMLVRFTGRLDSSAPVYEAVMPAVPTSDATR